MRQVQAGSYTGYCDTLPGGHVFDCVEGWGFFRRKYSALNFPIWVQMELRLERGEEPA